MAQRHEHRIIAEPPRPARSSGGLYRSRYDAKVAGVCAGIARHFDIDVAIVRILWVVLTVYPPGVGLIAYIICWIAMPKEPYRVPAASTQRPTITAAKIFSTRFIARPS